MDLKREMKRYIQNEVEGKVKWHAREHENQIADMVQMVINELDYTEQTLEKMTPQEFHDVLETEVGISIYEDVGAYLHWIYQEPDITPDNVIDDVLHYETLQNVAESKFNDYTFQLENKMIIVLGF